jgi:hypothetical protein
LLDKWTWEPTSFNLLKSDSVAEPTFYLSPLTVK